MNPLETYLARVKSRLPRKGRDDIVQELRVALLERCDQQEAKWGRPLTDAEQGVIVRGFGNPQTVAARYWTGTGLFGGPFTLYYRTTLLWGAAVTLIVHAALFAWRMTRGLDASAAFAATRPGLIFALITTVAVVTVVFALLDAGCRRMASPRASAR